MRKCYFRKYQNIAKALYLKSVKQGIKLDQAYNELGNKTSDDPEVAKALIQKCLYEDQKLNELDKKLHTIWKKTGCIVRTELHWLGMI